jgi:hypothetical protein
MNWVEKVGFIGRRGPRQAETKNQKPTGLIKVLPCVKQKPLFWNKLLHSRLESKEVTHSEDPPPVRAWEIRKTAQYQLACQLGGWLFSHSQFLRRADGVTSDGVMDLQCQCFHSGLVNLVQQGRHIPTDKVSQKSFMVSLTSSAVPLVLPALLQPVRALVLET